MGSPKALLECGGQKFAERLARLFTRYLDSCIVVLGHDAPAIRAALPRMARVSYVVNHAPERGMLSSLQCAIRVLPPEAEAAIFTPVDFPAIAAATIAALSGAQSSRPIIVPRCEGRRGHPVLCRRSILDELLRLPATSAPNEVIRRDGSRVHYVDVDDPNIHRDVDDLAAYEELLAEVPA